MTATITQSATCYNRKDMTKVFKIFHRFDIAIRTYNMYVECNGTYSLYLG